ncbi:glycerate kinase type-2 family protein [Sinorhizobium medicae]|uniref:glycerate kinase type-2 family protein n=1 Tax=Sinorhizobium medicae TaxID=110321 RepID=UPI00041783EB|nr:glycerate kinase [Sinorhizobium medicae]
MTRQWDEASVRRVLRDMFDAAVKSADPRSAVLGHLPERPKGRCVVVGAGKASAAMAAALDEAWPDVDLTGVVVTRYGYAVPAGRIEIIEAAHPVPDAQSLAASGRLLQAVEGLTSDDLVVALISGGGSSLLVAPAGKLTLEDKQAVNQALLASGATISEMNTVRKHLSNVKGGRLAQVAAPARLVTLVISDVPGDDLSEVASGPTVADPTTVREATEIVARYGLQLPAAAIEVLEEGLETPKPGELPVEARLVAAPSKSLEAAADVARCHGITPIILGDALEGEAREMGRVLAGIALSVRQHGSPVRAPAVLLSGGEGTVTIGNQQPGRGGRNTEFLLGLAQALKGASGIWAVAGDTDGIDGSEEAAGAIVVPTTLHRMKAQGLNPNDLLLRHDSFSGFAAIDDLLVTGPTLTNVNDIRAILVLP